MFQHRASRFLKATDRQLVRILGPFFETVDRLGRCVWPIVVVIGGAAASVFVLFSTLLLTSSVVAAGGTPVSVATHAMRWAPALFVLGGVALSATVMVLTLRYYANLVAPVESTEERDRTLSP